MTSAATTARMTPAKHVLLSALAALLCALGSLTPVAPAAAATPVEDMGCRMVIWASDSVFEHSYSHSGMRHRFRGCVVKRGWSTMAYRAMKERQWRLNNHLKTSECRVGTYHLSGVSRTHFKGIRVVVFKYRFGYLVPC